MDLFASIRPDVEPLGQGAYLLPGFADTDALLAHIPTLLSAAPLRRMMTPGGRQMNVAMSNTGQYGWVSDARGYRYDGTDPVSGKPWPAMPPSFISLAKQASEKAGYDGFDPDVCLINRYEVGTKLTPHIDQDEADKSWPIVSASIGIPAVFQLYGPTRGGKAQNIALSDGDVMVLGGEARHFYHGVKPIAAATDPRIGPVRYNLTFRRAR